MPTHDDVLAELGNIFLEIEAATATQRKLNLKRILTDDDENRQREAAAVIRNCWQKVRSQLEDLDRWPERHHLRQSSKILNFYSAGSAYENSVFLMTKFPEDGDATAEASQLRNVIDEVMKGVKARGHVPRIASEKDYHRWLWDNVELYLFGCARGIAIVEDKYRQELNPNVAMEWGWMVGMGREVLFLREKEFARGRADWSGLMPYQFEWNNPSPGIQAALDKWLAKS
jgi:hypothetical protein